MNYKTIFCIVLVACCIADLGSAGWLSKVKNAAKKTANFVKKHKNTIATAGKIAMKLAGDSLGNEAMELAQTLKQMDEHEYETLLQTLETDLSSEMSKDEAKKISLGFDIMMQMADSVSKSKTTESSDSLKDELMALGLEI